MQDQGRHKKLLSDNIAILEGVAAIEALKVQEEQLEKDSRSIEGGDTAFEEHSDARDRLQERKDKLNKIQGRFMEVVEMTRSLKRKLSQVS